MTDWIRIGKTTLTVDTQYLVSDGFRVELAYYRYVNSKFFWETEDVSTVRYLIRLPLLPAGHYDFKNNQFYEANNI